MKKILLVFIASLFTTFLMAQPPAGNADKGEVYGEKLNADGAISLTDLATKLQADKKFKGKIVGTVIESCTSKGCWLKMELPDKTKMQVSFKDYGFFVPKAIAGKKVILEGEARQKIVSVNEQKHYAEDAKKSQAEIDAITKPEKQVKFIANGVLVVG